MRMPSLPREPQPRVVPVGEGTRRVYGPTTSVNPRRDAVEGSPLGCRDVGASSNAAHVPDVLVLRRHVPVAHQRDLAFESAASQPWPRPATPPASPACTRSAGRPARGRSARTGSRPARRRRSRRAPGPPRRSGSPSSACPGSRPRRPRCPTRERSRRRSTGECPRAPPRSRAPRTPFRGNCSSRTWSPASATTSTSLRSSQASTRSARARIEFTFQVASRTPTTLSVPRA